MPPHGSAGQLEDVARQVLSLPMFPEITEEEIQRISDVINGATA